MSYELHFGRDEGIDRDDHAASPDVLNAMNWQLRIELEKALDDLNEAEAVKVVILRGGACILRRRLCEGAGGGAAVGFYSRHTYLHQLFYKFTKLPQADHRIDPWLLSRDGSGVRAVVRSLIASDDTKFGEPKSSLVSPMVSSGCRVSSARSGRCGSAFGRDVLRCRGDGLGHRQQGGAARPA